MMRAGNEKQLANNKLLEWPYTHICTLDLVARDVERGDSKVPLGVAPPLVACVSFEIKHPNSYAWCTSISSLLYL